MPDLRELFDPVAESTLRELIGGAIRTQAIHVAAKLSIADHLSLSALDAGELARRSNAHAPTLLRVLRYLVSIGVFVQLEDQRFALNRVGEYLQTAHPRSQRPSAIRAGESMWDVASRLLNAVQTGSTPYIDVHSQSFFERMAERGKDAEFSTRMGGSIDGIADALIALDCIRDAKRIVDVGGANGAMLTAILRAHPHLHGVLFDRPAMREVALERIAASGLKERCEFAGGDFFESVPHGDVHLLSWILHDWEDEQAMRILRACRAAARDGGSLLVVEVLLPERATVMTANEVLADPYVLDLQMLLLTGGRERTLEEYQKLLQAGGFEYENAAPLRSRRGATLIHAVA